MHAQPALFKDRRDAGQRLAKALVKCHLPHPLVVALPRGGVPVAAEVARALRALLDLLLVRKIGSPNQQELAVAAVADGPDPIIEFDELTLRLSGTSVEHVLKQMPQELAEIERRRCFYLGGRAPLPVQDHTVVLVDDGIATGTTVRVAIRSLRQRGARRVVLAVPVAPASEVALLSLEVDQLVCLRSLPSFSAVGAYYQHFEQTSDEEVIALMDGRS